MKTQADDPNTDDNNSRSLAENEKVGAKLAQENPEHTTGRTAGKNAVPQTSQDTPNYGDFGHAPLSDEEMNGPVAAGANRGAAASSTPAPDQRGAAPQNLNNEAVRATTNDESDDRREAAKLDDPRYGSGTRNWETAEPANRTTQADIDTNEEYRPAAD
ncbi:hypothetical protein SAMN00120144_2478 [Hymenobacter roseosalivarius DSM 11622]|uniref:Uncharacterized protein n=1 Tax=Hymenobacter roseosalivarius DSM 11622 TaxID=645990 RepID=A0A1W1VEK4_9BACT|nr:hypothetical protein [Hymenobacter roseosalivarius]SMB91867.1 hypothetical protein SAMN00120144_2478 [Hymenobacter roseosalivarius DSM 11622]